MQTKTKNKIPSRRIRKRYFFVLASLVPLLGSKIIPPHRMVQTMTMDSFYLTPFAGKDRIIKTVVHLHEDHKYYLGFSVTACIEENKTRGTYDLCEGLPYNYGKEWYPAGTDLPYTFNIKKEYFAEGDMTDFSMMFFYSERINTPPESLGTYSDYFYSGSIRPTTINSKMLPFKRDIEVTYAMFWNGDSFMPTKRHYTFNGTGFKDEYIADRYGIVPLNEMHFTPSYYHIDDEKLSMSSGELQIFNYIDDFNIGEIKEDKVKKRRYRSIPLELVTETNYSYLRTKDVYYVRDDLRLQTSENHENEQRWYQTRYVFLPPVKGYEARNYSFRIVMNDTGECCMDTFIHSFKVRKTANAYGSKYNSDFFVKEEITNV